MLRRLLDRVSIRLRVAGSAALLTFVILAAFALVVGQLTTDQITEDFKRDSRAAAVDLQQRLRVEIQPDGTLRCTSPDLDEFAASDDAVIRVLTLDGQAICTSRSAPDLGPPRGPESEVFDYLVETVQAPIVGATGLVNVQYAKPEQSLRDTISRVRLLLAIGVLSGALLALLVGLALARRALRPIAELTRTAREIDRTRDPSLHMPIPPTRDEVAELAQTIDGMLRSLDAAQAESEAILKRQREFVADASHELRTPLTSILANLEILTESVSGDDLHAAQSALRSSKRMRQLVADLLLLARADAKRSVPFEPLDLAAIAQDAITELEPLTEGRDLIATLAPAPVLGSRDELHRLVVNLIENALKYTPDGTEIRVSVSYTGTQAVLTVEDDGPGIPPELKPRLFERFVRGPGDSGGSTGLGLAIVQAVAASHDGTITVGSSASGGARFVFQLPLAD